MADLLLYNTQNSFSWSFDGDLQFYDGDIRVSTGSDFIARMASFWCKTAKGTWELYPQVGTNLSYYIGMQNIPAVTDLIQEEITTDINRNNFFMGTSFAFEITNILEASLEGRLYVLTPQISVYLFPFIITANTVEIYTSVNDPYVKPYYYPPVPETIYDVVGDSDPSYEE